MRALVVDDSTTVRMFHRTILEAAGFAVEEAMNGIEALERALGQAEPPDVMLVDVNMPRMDGYAFMQAIRTDPALRSVPAMMISTEPEEHDAERAFAVGANLYLIKPVRPEALTEYALALVGIPRETGA
jgi:two-component system chemotaxis response regulator CheY